MPLPIRLDLDAILSGIIDWARVESPTNHVAGVDRMMDLAEADMRGLGAVVERLPGIDGFGDCVVGRLPGPAGVNSPGILVLCHLDTVHNLGTLEGELPIRRDGDRLYGPGVFDMKGGARLAIEAMRAIRAQGITPRLPVTFMFTSDEEVGSPANRPRIEAEAARHRYVLVPEPARGNRCTTGRHAIMRFTVVTRGRPAHAGGQNRDGRSAIRVMARLIERIEGLGDEARGISYAVGVVQGGTFVNVVPIECKAQVLCVAPSEAIMAEIERAMLGLAGEESGVRIDVQRGPVRPIARPHPGTMALYERARAMAATVALDLQHGQHGGGSDGNFTGAMGLPTLDSLGVDGAGGHTFQEHLVISSLEPRCRLLAELMATLD